MNIELLTRALLDGRRVFERVCGRARECRNGPCRRRKVCLADAGEIGIDGSKEPWFQPTGGCPVMLEWEWKKVKTGIQANSSLLHPLFQAIDAKEDAEWAALPKAERAGSKKHGRRGGARAIRSPMGRGCGCGTSRKGAGSVIRRGSGVKGGRRRAQATFSVFSSPVPMFTTVYPPRSSAFSCSLALRNSIP